MNFFKSSKFYTLALIACILLFIYVLIFAIPQAQNYTGLSKYSSYIILAFFGYHIYFYGKKLYDAAKEKKENNS